MLKAKDFRSQAWSKLSGKWGTVVVAYLLMSFLIGLSGLVAIGPLLFTGPLTLGFSIIVLNIVRGKESEISTLFEAFNDFVRSFILFITNTILIGLWSLLFVIPGIIKSLSYSMAYFILKDNPELSANEARKKSMAMMQGNKWRLFCLYFSFIGWYLLSILTFGILFLWVMPYIQTAQAAFYESLKPAAPAQIPASAE